MENWCARGEVGIAPRADLVATAAIQVFVVWGSTGLAGVVLVLVVAPVLNGAWVVDVETGRAVDGDPAANDLIVAPPIGCAGVKLPLRQ